MTSAALTPAGHDTARPAPPWTTVIDGQRLRQLRRQRGLSQEGLADRAGLSLTTVARLERHPRPPCRTWTLARLAIALDAPPAAIAPPATTAPTAIPPAAAQSAPAARGTRR